MGLIIKDKIPMFMRGYPTVSDKYDVAGGVLTGANAVQFGDPVKFSATKGYFEKGTGMAAITELAGFVVATNVKLANEWPGQTVQTQPGEAFNLLVKGFIAIELANTAVVDNIKANKAVAIVLATGALTTSGVAGATDIPNCVFTGLYENHGTAEAPKYFAEILVK